jgi:hypothetical protein
MLDYHKLVHMYGLHPYLVHLAFLNIDEYQSAIKSNGCGPDRDELGHDPNVGFGQVCRHARPRIRVFQIGESIHFWPEFEDWWTVGRGDPTVADTIDSAQVA